MTFKKTHTHIDLNAQPTHDLPVTLLNKYLSFMPVNLLVRIFVVLFICPFHARVTMANMQTMNENERQIPNKM